MPSPRKTRTIAILALPGVQLLDVSGPLDVFAEANVQAGSRLKSAAPYRLQIIATRPGPIRSSSGIRLLADTTIGERGGNGKFDTVLVAGCPNAAERHRAAVRRSPYLGQIHRLELLHEIRESGIDVASEAVSVAARAERVRRGLTEGLLPELL